jgi:acetyl-CoA synthetase
LIDPLVRWSGGKGIRFGEGMTSTEKFIRARDFLIRYREDYETAYKEFRWPDLDEFNWALDYFDVHARNNSVPALWLVDEKGEETKLSYADLAARSNSAAR